MKKYIAVILVIACTLFFSVPARADDSTFTKWINTEDGFWNYVFEECPEDVTIQETESTGNKLHTVRWKNPEGFDVENYDVKVYCQYAVKYKETNGWKIDNMEQFNELEWKEAFLPIFEVSSVSANEKETTINFSDFQEEMRKSFVDDDNFNNIMNSICVGLFETVDAFTAIMPKIGGTDLSSIGDKFSLANYLLDCGDETVSSSVLKYSRIKYYVRYVDKAYGDGIAQKDKDGNYNYYLTLIQPDGSLKTYKWKSDIEMLLMAEADDVIHDLSELPEGFTSENVPRRTKCIYSIWKKGVSTANANYFTIETLDGEYLSNHRIQGYSLQTVPEAIKLPFDSGYNAYTDYNIYQNYIGEKGGLQGWMKESFFTNMKVALDYNTREIFTRGGDVESQYFSSAVGRVNSNITNYKDGGGLEDSGENEKINKDGTPDDDSKKDVDNGNDDSKPDDGNSGDDSSILTRIYMKLCDIYNLLLVNTAANVVDALWDVISGLFGDMSAMFETLSNDSAEKFPFSIYFTLEAVFVAFSAKPVTPEFNIPLKLPGMIESINIDFSIFDGFIPIFRSLQVLLFGLYLLRETGNAITLIKGVSLND